MDLAGLKIFLINFLTILGNILTYAIFARIILSWFSMGSARQPGRITYFIIDITDPFIKLAKKIPHSVGMLDFSPFIAMIAINILTYGLIQGVMLI